MAFLTIDVREHIRNYRGHPSFGAAPQALLQGFAQLPHDVEIHVISCLRQPVQPAERLAPNIHYHGLLVPSIGWGKSLYSGCVRAVRRKLREIRPDAVHGQGTERDCALSAALSGFPNVLTLHGNMRQVAKALRASRFSFFGLTAFLEGWTLPRSSGVVCLTRYTHEQVKDLARKTWIIPNAVDQSFFDVRPVVARSRNVLCVANLMPYKGQTSLIRALDPVAGANGIRLVFLGAGNPSDPYVREFSAMVKARPWCTHDGFKQGEELKAAFRDAQLLILPSMEDNCPMVILEAMAAGVPVAASGIGGIPDLIEDQVNGLLFDPTNPSQMRASILRLLNEVSFAGSIAAAGRQRALDHYHPIVVARRHLEIYREISSTCE